MDKCCMGSFLAWRCDLLLPFHEPWGLLASAMSWLLSPFCEHVARHKTRSSHVPSRVSLSYSLQHSHESAVELHSRVRNMVLPCAVSVSHAHMCSRSYFRAATIRSQATQLKGAEQVTVGNSSWPHGFPSFARHIMSKGRGTAARGPGHCCRIVAV